MDTSAEISACTFPSSDSILDPKKFQSCNEPQSWREIAKAWPKSTFCIVGDELCEKFSYFGMRAILTLYFLNVLNLSEKYSIIFFNSFILISMVTPLFGSFVADGFIGKYRTIFLGSIFLIIAQLMLTFSSSQDSTSFFHPWLDAAGLLTISISNGGTKPCVSSFGADQFEPSQTKMISLFFSVFYFFINVSSMISTFVSPVFRTMPCLGHDSCYPLVFGTCAVLMTIATGTFMIGSFSYKKRAPKGNIFGQVAKIVKGAICNRNTKNSNRNHWLERYLDTHDCETDSKCLKLKQRKQNPNACQKSKLIHDIRGLISVLIMYIPVPLYWALYDQQGSVWLIQGIQMDCRIWGNTLLLPDQIRLINPIPLRKMTAGGILAALSFVCAGLIQLEINKTLPSIPPKDYAYISIMNSLKPNCSIKGIGDYPFKSLDYNMSLVNNKATNTFEMIEVHAGKNITFNFQHSCGRSNKKNYVKEFTTAEIKNGKTYNLIISELGAIMVEVNPEKPKKGTGEFSLSFTMALNDTNYFDRLALCRQVNTKTKANEKYPCDPKNSENFYYFEMNQNNEDQLYATDNGFDKGHIVSTYDFKAIRPGNWSIWYFHNQNKKSENIQSLSTKNLNFTNTGHFISITEQGGVYAAVFTGSYDAQILQINQLVPSNKVNILWQLPQYFILSVAEILFEITGYEFAYSQAPSSMKALVQALWLFTVAAGDLLIVAVELLNIFENFAIQFFAYAGAMLFCIIIFALLSIFYYEYRSYHDDVDDVEDDDDLDLIKNEEKTDISTSISGENLFTHQNEKKF